MRGPHADWTPQDLEDIKIIAIHVNDPMFESYMDISQLPPHVLREMARVSRRGVIVNDLDRTQLSWLGAWLLAHLATRNRYTRHDAPLSVRRAYRPVEVQDMAAAVGLTRVARLGGFMGHRYALVLAPATAATRRESAEHG